MSESDIANIKAKIAHEYESAYNGLYGLAAVAMVPHHYRTQCTERICDAHQQLIRLVGPDQAIKMVAEVLDPQYIASYDMKRDTGL